MSDLDKAKAEALRIAYDRLAKNGWGFSAEDLGEYAAKMINSMERNLRENGNG